MNSFGSVRGQLHLGAPRRRAGNVTGSQPQSKAAPVPGSYFTLAQDWWVPLDPERWEHCCLSAQYTCQRPATIWYTSLVEAPLIPAHPARSQTVSFFSSFLFLLLTATQLLWQCMWCDCIYCGGPTAYDALTIASSPLGPCGISVSIHNTKDYAAVSWDQTESRRDGLMLRPPCCRLLADDDSTKPPRYWCAVHLFLVS